MRDVIYGRPLTSPEAQFPSATPLLAVHVSVERQVPNMTRFVLAELSVVHWLKKIPSLFIIVHKVSVSQIWTQP